MKELSVYFTQCSACLLPGSARGLPGTLHCCEGEEVGPTTSYNKPLEGESGRKGHQSSPTPKPDRFCCAWNRAWGPSIPGTHFATRLHSLCPFLLCVFETRSFSVAPAGLECVILLTPPAEWLGLQVDGHQIPSTHKFCQRFKSKKKAGPCSRLYLCLSPLTPTPTFIMSTYHVPDARQVFCH